MAKANINATGGAFSKREVVTWVETHATLRWCPSLGGGNPSEPLLSVGWRWPWGTSRSARVTGPQSHSRLTWQRRSPWCRLIRRAPSPPFKLARPPGSAVHSPLRNSCLIKKVIPKRNWTLSYSGVILWLAKLVRYFLTVKSRGT